MQSADRSFLGHSGNILVTVSEKRQWNWKVQSDSPAIQTIFVCIELNCLHYHAHVDLSLQTQDGYPQIVPYTANFKVMNRKCN